ncbi:MAG TPA: hypothetical protein VKM96_04235 [Candidatus Bathyarchaeia archaeon]|nr:hypothetical protein [Candidatus Bathyarchaeia archaeon]
MTADLVLPKSCVTVGDGSIVTIFEIFDKGGDLRAGFKFVLGLD